MDALATRIADDVELNPDGMPVRLFLKTWWEQRRGKGPGRQLAKRLRCDEEVLYRLIKDLGFKQPKGRCRPRANPEIEERNSLIRKAKAGSTRARRQVLSRYGLKVFSRKDIESYEQLEGFSHDALRA